MYISCPPSVPFHLGTRGRLAEGVPEKSQAHPINVKPSQELRHVEINQDQLQENRQRLFTQSSQEQGRLPHHLLCAETQKRAGVGGLHGGKKGRKVPVSCSEAVGLRKPKVGRLELGDPL